MWGWRYPAIKRSPNDLVTYIAKVAKLTRSNFISIKYDFSDPDEKVTARQVCENLIKLMIDELIAYLLADGTTYMDYIDALLVKIGVLYGITHSIQTEICTHIGSLDYIRDIIVKYKGEELKIHGFWKRYQTIPEDCYVLAETIKQIKKIIDRNTVSISDNEYKVARTPLKAVVCMLNEDIEMFRNEVGMIAPSSTMCIKNTQLMASILHIGRESLFRYSKGAKYTTTGQLKNLDVDEISDVLNIDNCRIECELLLCATYTYVALGRILITKHDPSALFDYRYTGLAASNLTVFWGSYMYNEFISRLESHIKDGEFEEVIETHKKNIIKNIKEIMNVE